MKLSLGKEEYIDLKTVRNLGYYSIVSNAYLKLCWYLTISSFVRESYSKEYYPWILVKCYSERE